MTMRRLAGLGMVAAIGVVLAACSNDESDSSSGTGGADSGGTPGTGGTDPGGATGTGGSLATGGSGGTPVAGNPDGSCSAGIPAEGQPVDTSTPATVVGTGTAASCTFSALEAAVTAGGIITFDCGADPVTIAVTATLNLPTDRSTVIDGGNQITLDGEGQVQILRFDHPDWMVNDNGLTLQHLSLINGKTTPAEAIPPAPAPCSQGFNDGEGGALYVRDGTLRVIDVTFENNQAAQLGPDTGGGAIYVNGSKPAFIVSSTFRNNSGSNAGGIGALFVELNLYDCLFTGNQATGNGANGDDATQCSVINNGQHQVGSGGNGGAIYSDGVGVSMNVCGTQVVGNHANAFGAAIFFTSNDAANRGSLAITDSTLTGNVQDNDYWEDGGPGISTNANVIPPVNSVISD
jgi:predicted outer membrane repeat protein